MDFFGAIMAILFFVVFAVTYHVLNQALADKEWLKGREQRISSKRKEG